MSYLYVYLDPQNLNDQRLKIKLEFNDLNLSSITVEQLKDKLLSNSQIDLPANYDLTFFGRCLKSDSQLSNYGVKTGANLFVLPNFHQAQPTEQNESSKEKKPKFEKNEIQKMMIAIRTALVNSNFRSMLNRLYDKDFRENVAACTPSLRDNIISFSILQDPELMMICSDPENLTKISEKYSVFTEAATAVATAFHEEILQSNQSNGSSSANLFGQSIGQENAYSLQNYESDEDDLGGVDAAPPAGQQITNETQPHLQNQITVDMIRHAIRAARSESPPNIVPSTSRQQNNSGQTNTNSLTNLSSSSNSLQTLTSNNNQRRSDWTQQLNQMREMGFNNDAIAIQALEATNGNIEEAVNLYCDLNNQNN